MGSYMKRTPNVPSSDAEPDTLTPFHGDFFGYLCAALPRGEPSPETKMILTANLLAANDHARMTTQSRLP